jgi:creatinine amidohydrolase
VWSEWGPLRYARLTWPEVRRAAAGDRVALVPVATLEDHGPHLPVDTDLRIVTELCERAAAEAAGRVVLLPAIPHGYDPHHMDFPGAITRRPLARPPWVPADAVPERPRLQPEPGRDGGPAGDGRAARGAGGGRVLPGDPEALAVIERVRDSTRGGMAHACELETSIDLAIDPDAVDMDLAVDERGYPEGEHAWLDWSDGSLKLMPWWSAFSRSGVQGDATKATAAKGRQLLAAAVAECVAYVDELLAKPLPRRRSPAAEGGEAEPPG